MLLLRSIIKFALRSLVRNASYSITTILGLVTGITASILVFLWISFEVSYDRYDAENERVYAVMVNENVDGEIETYEESPVPLAEYFSNEVSEVEAFTRFDNSRAMLKVGDKSVQKLGAYADSGYFKVFKPIILAGNPEMMLEGYHSIAISDELAETLFEKGDALGKTITLDLKKDFKVSAIFKSFPQNSSLRGYQFILPFNAKARSADDWENYYVKLYDVSAKEKVESKINKKFSEFPENSNSTTLLFPLTDWRLHWNFENGETSGGRIVFVIAFGLAAVFVLIMAAINYINMATARAAKRAREVGVRKMTGASQGALIRQFMIESIAITFISTSISVLLAWLTLPFFNELTGISLQLKLTDLTLILGLIGIASFTGIIAGIYPAFLLSSLKPALVLKGNLHYALTGSGLRKILVTFQFTLSIALIFSALVLRQQTNFLLQQDLGFDKNNVIDVWLDRSQNLPLEQLRNEILNHSSIESAGFGGANPMEINGSAEVTWPGKADKNPVLINGVSTHYDMLSTLNFEFLEGRNFSREFNETNNFIITQKAAELMGLKKPVGQTIRYQMFGPQEGTIVGVVKDFHNEDIHVAASPVIFAFDADQYLFNFFIRYKEGQHESALAHIKNVFDKFQPGIPIDQNFLDAEFQNQFYMERMLNNLSVWFTILAVVIACLGLLGLTMFNTERRTKEIGIRKVLGASVAQVIKLLVHDFFKPIFFSFILAFPVAYFLMEKFLESYPTRINISLVMFLIVGVVMVILVTMTIAYQSLKAATRNPVESLRIE